MSKHRQSAKIDRNQNSIIETLRKMGYSVAPGHDDIMVGVSGEYGELTLWFEIKDMETWLKCGCLKAGTIKPSQVALIQNWKGHYCICWTFDQILNEIRRQEKLLR